MRAQILPCGNKCLYLFGCFFFFFRYSCNGKNYITNCSVNIVVLLMVTLYYIFDMVTST